MTDCSSLTRAQGGLGASSPTLLVVARGWLGERVPVLLCLLWPSLVLPSRICEPEVFYRLGTNSFNAVGVPQGAACIPRSPHNSKAQVWELFRECWKAWEAVNGKETRRKT